MLKVVQIFLCTGQRVMDFSTLCEHKGISTRYEKALLKTCVRRTDHGFEWNVADDIDYDLVRQVIEVAKTISDVELDIPTPLIKIGKEEPKSEFENSTEKVESKNEVEEISINERRKYNIFIMLQTLRKVIATKRISSISEYCTNFNLTNNLGGVLVELNIIQKIKGSYVWIGSDPSKELVEQINQSYIERSRKYYDNKKATKNTTTSQTLTPSIQTPAPTILGQIVTEVKNDEVTRLKKLAEKFAKAGNYDMAEQLLDQVLTSK